MRTAAAVVASGLTQTSQVNEETRFRPPESGNRTKSSLPSKSKPCPTRPEPKPAPFSSEPSLFPLASWASPFPGHQLTSPDGGGRQDGAHPAFPEIVR